MGSTRNNKCMQVSISYVSPTRIVCLFYDKDLFAMTTFFQVETKPSLGISGYPSVTLEVTGKKDNFNFTR